MDDIDPEEPVNEEEMEALFKDINMDEFAATFRKVALEMMKAQAKKPFETQILQFCAYLLIPASLILFCFCKILRSQNKRHGKDKKKEKEKKKETKKEIKKETKKETKKKA